MLRVPSQTRKQKRCTNSRRPYAPESRDGSERITQRYWRMRRIRDLRSSTALPSLGGWPTLFLLILTLEGAPSWSRFLRQGGEFDLPRTGWSRSRNPRPVPATSAGTRTGHPLEQLVTKGRASPPWWGNPRSRKSGETWGTLKSGTTRALNARSLHSASLRSG